MKLTVAPAHIVVADAVIDTLGVTAAFTVIVIVFDVSFVFDAQATLLVNTQETVSYTHLDVYKRQQYLHYSMVK